MGPVVEEEVNQCFAELAHALEKYASRLDSEIAFASLARLVAGWAVCCGLESKDDGQFADAFTSLMTVQLKILRKRVEAMLAATGTVN
jgi:hypothetical protein